ncbi:MAG: hypothetical protein IPK17_26540 [Chloroflexi bacterium]|uniref:glycoside hydrolase family 2 protein n=1 Tax=Candidatus Flexifilum breve TaxID=3140694 RepID=UPI0031369BA3|nr:hypothetical protein [Chloroflexota bacterium]
MRQQLSLAGQWDFQLDPAGQLAVDAVQPDRTIPVPMPIQAAFPELRRYSGYMWYQRSFDVTEGDGELLLDFGAVDYWCQVFVNAALVAEHEGGYMPFRIPIRRYVQAGANRLTVRVYDTIQTQISVPRWMDKPAPEGHQPPFHAETIPHGKQTWYLDASGIWQDVTLTSVPTRYIDQVHVTPDIHTGQAHVRVKLAGAATEGAVRVNIGGVTGEALVGADQAEVTVTVSVPNPSLWTPHTPTLYTADVQFGSDQLAVRFGFREIRVNEGMLLLNGEPFYLLCALDQDLYPDTIYTVPSDDFLRDQFVKAKQMGLNSLRCHIKPPDPRYYDVADEIGLLIWSEIPSWRTFYGAKSAHPNAYFLDDAVKARARAIMHEMIARDFNHPSLMIWTMINEDWGSTLLLSADDRAWIAEMVDECRQLDPTRLVVDNSPCPAPWGFSVHVKSDLDDFHVYTNIPDQADTFEEFVEGLASRPLWSFSNTGDAQRTGHEAIILSEFGNWGVPSLKQFGGGLPDWADLSGWWSPWDGEAGRAEGLLERYEALGLKSIWPDYEAFAAAAQWHEYHALKYEIETMRRLPKLQGYVITELSDIYWESNGLLDFARNEKVFHHQLAQFNAEDVIVPQLDRYAYWSDESARVTVYASHYSPEDWAGARATVSADGAVLLESDVSDMKRGAVHELGSVSYKLAGSNGAISLSVSNGKTLTTNMVQLTVLPVEARQAAFRGEVAVVLRPAKSNAAIDAWSAPAVATPVAQDQLVESAEAMHLTGSLLRGSGYTVTRTISDSTKLVISDNPTADVLAWVQAGGDLLYLANNAGSPFFWVNGRGGTYGGRWITSWNWLRPGIYKRVPVDNPLKLPFMDMTPDGVILGLPVTDAAVQGDFLAGQIAGWAQHPALHTVQFRYGQGRVIMTTYPIRESLHFQPLALAMLHDLVDHLSSEACQPVLSMNYR